MMHLNVVIKMQFLEKMHMKKLEKVMAYKNYDIDHNSVIWKHKNDCTIYDTVYRRVI